MKLKALILLTLLILPAAATAQEQEKGAKLMELLAGWQQRLKLTDEQKTQTKALLEKLGQELAPLADKTEAGEELDKKAAFKQIQSARRSFETSFAAILTDEQKKEWGVIQEETRDHVAKAIGQKRAAKMQQQYKLSDTQMQACAPVLADQTAALMQEIDEIQDAKAAGEAPGRRRPARRDKLQQARELKDIAGEADAELKKIFTPEQWQQYEADKAKRKEEMKAKRGH